MTETDLMDLIHERVGSPRKEAGKVVEAVFAIIRESLRDRRKSARGRVEELDH